MPRLPLPAAPLLLLMACGQDPAPEPTPAPAAAPVAPAAPVFDTPARQRAVELIEASPFTEQAAVIAGALAPHVTLQPRRTTMDALPMGASRLAGQPDLPPGLPWPMFGDEPMALLAQIDLAAVNEQVPPDTLPETGWLYLFWAVETGGWGYEAKDTASFTLHYHQGPVDELVRTAPPDGLPEMAQAFEPCALSFEPGVALPQWLDLRYPKELDLQENLDAMYELWLRVTGLEPPGGSLHHLLGHPQLVQGDPRGKAATFRGGEPDDWNLLLQLDTDEPGPNWMWGDVGTVYVYVQDADLAQGRFDQAWLVAQGH